LNQAVKTKALWLLMFCQAIPSMLVTGVTFHVVSIMAEKGLSAAVAATVLTSIAVVGFPITFFAGYLLDRLDGRKVIAGVFLGMLFSLFLLNRVNDPLTAVIFGAVIGASNGTMLVANNVVYANYFGVAHLGSIKGFSTASLVIGSAFGPLPFGLAFDLFHSYDQIITLMMIFPVLGFLSAVFAKKPENKASIS